jgi:hypothetical protein
MPPQCGYGGRLLLQRQLPRPPQIFFRFSSPRLYKLWLIAENRVFQQYPPVAEIRLRGLDDGSCFADIGPALLQPALRLQFTLTAGRGPTAEKIGATLPAPRDWTSGVRGQSRPSRGRCAR